MTESGTRNYVAILDKILKSYNSRPHRMLGNKTPEFAEKNPTNAYIATKNQEYLDSKRSKKRPIKCDLGCISESVSESVDSS